MHCFSIITMLEVKHAKGSYMCLLCQREMKKERNNTSVHFALYYAYVYTFIKQITNNILVIT